MKWRYVISLKVFLSLKLFDGLESCSQIRSNALSRASIGLPEGHAFEKEMPVSPLSSARPFFWGVNLSILRSPDSFCGASQAQKTPVREKKWARGLQEDAFKWEERGEDRGRRERERKETSLKEIDEAREQAAVVDNSRGLSRRVSLSLREEKVPKRFQKGSKRFNPLRFSLKPTEKVINVGAR